MKKIKSISFECYYCGSTELEYQEYVKCTTPVSIQDGQVKYGEPLFDQDDNLATFRGYACKSCGKILEHCGVSMETEKQLIDYLEMPEEIRQQQQQEYDEIQMYTNNVFESPAHMEAIDELL